MPIRWRLSLWFSLILCIILVATSAFIYSMVQHYLFNEVDDNLKTHSAEIHSILELGLDSGMLEHEALQESLPLIDEFATPGIYIQIIDRDGYVMAKSDNLGDQELPIDPEFIDKGFQGQSAIETVSAARGADLRIMISPLIIHSDTMLVEVAQSLSHVDATMSNIRLALTASGITALVVAIVSSIFLARRALTPVGRVTETAQEIAASSNLDRQVGYKGPMDEVGRLANTFDHMIDRLRQVFESQEQFVAAASHDLRSPLAVIRTNIDLLSRDLTDEDRSECLGAIQREIERMIKIIDELLLLAEVQSAQTDIKEKVSLKHIIDDAVVAAQRSASDRRITILRNEDLVVTGNSHRLSRMIANLLDNAIKYTSDGSSIEVSSYQEQDRVYIEVCDNGIGINSDELPYIFDRFYRADKARPRDKGIGLGLTIAKSIAEQHNGHIDVESEPGRGTKFTIVLTQ